MIPHNINRDRFDYLVIWGVTPGELKSFFKDRRNALIISGARVQNPPSDRTAAMILLHQFSAESHRVFGTWIQELADNECNIDPNQWIPRYRAIEQLGVIFPENETRAVARAGLKELYKAQPREDWIRFLCSVRSKDVESPVEAGDDTVLPSQDEWLAFGKWLCGLGSLNVVSSPVLLDAAAIVAEWDRREPPLVVGTEEGRRALPAIEKLFEETERPVIPPPARRGLQSAAPPIRTKEEGIDYLALPVIATRVHSPHSGPYMAQVEAFVDESGAFRLESPVLRDVVKTLGKVAVFPDRGFAEPPPGEAVMYRVEAHVTSLPVKVRVREVLEAGLIPVVRLPYSTKEAHLIRKGIERYARDASARPAVFVTTDDLCLKPRVDSFARLSARGHDWVLDTWEYLDGLELSVGTYVLARLPSPTGRLSCAPLAAAAVKLLRDDLRGTQVGLTKNQTRLLLELLQDETLGSDDLSRERLSENIQLIAAAGEDYDELVGLLMDAPVVQADIERRVVSRVDELITERRKEMGAIEGLRSQCAAMEARLEKLRMEVEEKTRAVRGAVVRAFEKASKKEIEALGEASVLLALIGRDLRGNVRGEIVPTDGVVEHPQAQSGAPLQRVQIRKVAPARGDITDILRKFGLSSETSERVSRALQAALALRLPIITRGSGARQLAANLAEALSTRELDVCEVPIGLMLNEGLVARLEVGDGGAVLFVDANLSDLSVYAPDVLDAVVTGALGGKGALGARPLVFSLSSGPAGLPLPAELTELAVDLDLNVLGRLFDAQQGTPLRTQGILAKRALKRLDSDVSVAKLDFTPAVIDDLSRLMCQP